MYLICYGCLGPETRIKFDILCIRLKSTAVLNYDRTLSDFEMGACLEPRGHLVTLSHLGETARGLVANGSISCGLHI